MKFTITEKPTKQTDTNCYKNYFKLIGITFKDMSIKESKRFYKENFRSIGVVINNSN
jgi:hypothetical protein